MENNTDTTPPNKAYVVVSLYDEALSDVEAYRTRDAALARIAEARESIGADNLSPAYEGIETAAVNREGTEEISMFELELQ